MTFVGSECLKNSLFSFENKRTRVDKENNSRTEEVLVLDFLKLLSWFYKGFGASAPLLNHHSVGQCLCFADVSVKSPGKL